MNVESVSEELCGWGYLTFGKCFLSIYYLKSIFQIHANQIMLTPHHVALLHNFVIHNVTGIIKMEIFKAHLSKTITSRLYPLSLIYWPDLINSTW